MEKFVFEGEAPEETTKETTKGAVLRNVARTGARVAEVGLGLTGDLAQGAMWGAKQIGKIPEALGIGKLSDYLGEVTGTKFLQDIDLPTTSDRLPIPTSQDVYKYGTKNIEKLLPKDYLEAQGGWEKLADEVFSDITRYTLSPTALGRLPFKRALAAVGLGNAAKQLAKKLNAGEGTQEVVKVGTMLATTLFGRSQIGKHVTKLYNKADASVPVGTSLSAKPIKPFLKNLKKGIADGDQKAGSNIFMKDRINALESKFTPSNTIKVSELRALKRNFNELLARKSKLFVMEKKFPSMIKKMTDMLYDYGKKNNPTFYKAFRDAESMHAGWREMSKVNRFMQENLTNKNLSLATATMLVGDKIGALAGQHMGSLGKGGLKYVGAAFLAKQGVRLAESMLRSRPIAKYYTKTLSAAFKKNIPLMVKNAKLLDEKIKKEYPEFDSNLSEQFVFE